LSEDSSANQATREEVLSKYCLSSPGASDRATAIAALVDAGIPFSERQYQGHEAAGQHCESPTTSANLMPQARAFPGAFGWTKPV